jgi:hypothetical protein
MRRSCFIMAVLCFFAVAAAAAHGEDLLDSLKKVAPNLPAPGGASASGGKGASLDEGTIASGLKQALSVGTKNAVALVSKVDGYFGNAAIKILLPEKIQGMAEMAGKLGFQKQVDDFILSMNRAAEKAAPKAASQFAAAIKAMTVEDARKILSGGDTAATEYFRSKTSSKLYDEFKPDISSSMQQVGVARAYQNLVGKVPETPFTKPGSMDLDDYVTTKALDGLFHMVGQEEQKIRTNPAARTTDLLKKVFGR